MTDPVRFPAQLPYEKWPKAAHVYALMIAGDWAGAEAYFNDPANTQDITDAMGAGNYWRAQYNPGGAVVPTEPSSVNNNSVSLPWFTSPMNQINATVSNGAGRASASCGSGGDLVWVSTDPAFPLIEGITSSGAGMAGPVVVAAGQTFYFKQTTAATQQMRASVAA